jgi:hypothetical protein
MKLKVNPSEVYSVAELSEMLCISPETISAKIESEHGLQGWQVLQSFYQKTATAIDADLVCESLNNYKGDNIWQDIILWCLPIDQEACEACDSDTVHLADGQVILHTEGRWEVV